MPIINLIHQRLSNQRLIGEPFKKPEEAVSWLGAVQAQEYPGAKWGLAQRMQGVVDADFDRAFASGKILRTHVMRPTWHFVAPEDIRWLLKLTAPRVHAVSAYQYRKQNIDDALMTKAKVVLTKALQGGQHLTRTELAAALEKARIKVKTDDHLRLTYIVMWAELDGLICSGAMRGKQHTYALLEERVPKVKVLKHTEALAELVRRFFTSHGPATVKDFCWWSGLTTADARAGLEMNGSNLSQEIVEGITYWFAPQNLRPLPKTLIAHLLPAYDEYTIAYKNHEVIYEPQYVEQVIASSGIVIVINGRIVGGWKRTFEKEAVVIALYPFRPLTKAEQSAITVAAKQFGKFLDRPVKLNWAE